MTDGQAARPQYVSLDTPHGLLELTWPQPQQVYAEGLEAVAGIYNEEPVPTALLDGKPITVRRAGQIVAGMQRTANLPDRDGETGAPDPVADPAGMFYLLVCRTCGTGDLAMPFDSAAERGKWAAEHTSATGHDRWFATETAGRLSRQQVAEMIARNDEVLRRCAGD